MVERNEEEAAPGGTGAPGGAAADTQRRLLTLVADDEITCHLPFSVKNANQQLTAAIERALEGDLVQVRRAIEALPPTHPRRKLLLSNLREAVALLQDLPGILAR